MKMSVVTTLDDQSSFIHPGFERLRTNIVAVTYIWGMAFHRCFDLYEFVGFVNVPTLFNRCCGIYNIGST